MANPSKHGLTFAFLVAGGLTYFLLHQFPDRREGSADEAERSPRGHREVASSPEENSEAYSAHETENLDEGRDVHVSVGRPRESGMPPDAMAAPDADAPRRHLADKRQRLLEASQRKSKLATYGGELMSFEGVPYRALKGHGAWPARAAPPTGAVFLQKKGGYAIYRLPPKMPTGATLPLPVFENESNGAFAVWTGQVVVRFKNVGDIARFAQDQGLEIVQRFDHLQTAMFRMPRGEDWSTRLALVRRDGRVEKAEADILETPAKSFGSAR